MTKRVALERLRDISRTRTVRRADEPPGFDEQRLTIEWPIEAEPRLLQ
jgi:hypothetical protein